MRLRIPAPSEKQRQFLTDGHRYLAFGGARGGGKSWAVRVKAVLLCFRYAGIKAMIVRKTYPELRANHIVPLCELLRAADPDRERRFAEYSEAHKELRFPNGSVILFRYCDTEADADRFQGAEADVLFIDEATQQSEEQLEKLKACVRGVNAFPKRIYYTCNPGGPGHAWIKRLFLDREYRGGERAEDYAFIQSLAGDNRALREADPDYIRRLESLPPKLREAWLYGRWDSCEGRFFEEFRTRPDLAAARAAGCELSEEELLRQRRWTHVIEPFDLARGECAHWTLLRSYDFGYGRPFSCAWWAVDFDGVLYRVLELYGCAERPNEGVKWTPERQFAEIARIEREHPWLRGRIVAGVADPAIWDASRGESIAETAARCGVYFSPGDNKRIPGWMQLHYRLQFDENGFARMYVFSNCRAFIRTLPTLVYDPHRPEDLDTAGEDHAADETRYLCMSRPVGPLRPAESSPAALDPLKAFVRRPL
ncbi:MAG: phage terminase large subunit [Oscillospiraceae bacterium]|nr:phage terminase large subunit [Oscillospiraceae bacterium]